MGWQFLTLVGLRSLVFLVTSGALGCHIANIILFTTYAKSISLPSWSTHLEYIFYLIALGLSFICSVALLVTFAFSLNSLRADKYVSIINTIVIAAFLIYNTIKMGSDYEPWVNNTLAFKKTPNPGFMTYCSAFQSSDVPMGSNLFLRCWLINGLWIGMIVSCVAWVALGIFAWTQHKSEVFEDDDDYHYKSDVPLVPVQSPSISYNNAQAYSRDDPYDRGLTTSPAAKAAATYAYNGNKPYDNYSQPATPKYSDYNASKPPTPAQGYGNRYDGNDGYVENYVPYRRQDDVSPGAQTQASKFQDDEADDYYGTSTPELSPKRYQSPHTAVGYGGGSPGYQNAYGGYQNQNPSYDYRSNNRYARNNSYE